tara:strand:+ start:653 stop:1402 length:750 start_codon:yes stop_codon:yes gene_type:complete
MIDGKVIVISGGAGLLGKEFCQSIAANNGKVIIIDKCSKEKIIKREIKHDYFISIDICSKELLQNAVKKVIQKFGRIDALVNVAYPKNKNYGNDFFDVKINDFNENIATHLGGYFLTTQVFSKYFKDAGKGNIINISSIYGVIAPKFKIYDKTSLTVPVEYALTKAAIIQMSKYLAIYFKNSNIRVNSISPGGIKDNQPETFIKNYNNETLNKGMLDKNDINGTLLFLLSDMSKYINGQNIIVDDGFSL